MTAPRTPEVDHDGFAEQVDELGRQIRDNDRRFPKMVEAGRLHQGTADRKQDLLLRLHTRCCWVRDNLDWIVAEARRRKLHEQLITEIDALRTDPAVAAVLEAFPGADIADVRPLERAR